MAEELTERELQDLARLCERASQGPWQADRLGQGHVRDSLNRLIARCGVDTTGKGEINAAFIARARTDVPRLIAEVQRLRGAARSGEGD